MGGKQSERNDENKYPGQMEIRSTPALIPRGRDDTCTLDGQLGMSIPGQYRIFGLPLFSLCSITHEFTFGSHVVRGRRALPSLKELVAASTSFAKGEDASLVKTVKVLYPT